MTFIVQHKLNTVTYVNFCELQ